MSLGGYDGWILIRVVIESLVELGFGVSVELVGLLVLSEIGLSVLSGGGERLNLRLVVNSESHQVREDETLLPVVWCLLVESDVEAVAELISSVHGVHLSHEEAFLRLRLALKRVGFGWHIWSRRGVNLVVLVVPRSGVTLLLEADI